MPTIENSILIYAKREEIFDLTQNYDLRLKWDTYLKVARLLENKTEAEIGVKAYCESKKGIGMTVEYITFKRPDFTAMKMIDKSLLFKKFSGSWRFKTVDDQTLVIFRYNYEFRFSFLNFLANFIISFLLKTDIIKRLKGLKKAIENDNILASL